VEGQTTTFQLNNLLSNKQLKNLELYKVMKGICKEFNIHVYFYDLSSEANTLFGQHNIFLNQELSEDNLWLIFCKLLSDVLEDKGIILTEKRIQSLKNCIINHI